MKNIDILLLILLLWGGYRGFRSGLLAEACSVGVSLVAIPSTIKLFHSIRLLFSSGKTQEYIGMYVIFVILFVVVIILITLLGRLCSHLGKHIAGGVIDQVGGSLLGICKWGMLTSFCIWVGDLFQFSLPATYTENAWLFPLVQSLAPYCLTWLSSWLPFVQSWLQTLEDNAV